MRPLRSDRSRGGKTWVLDIETTGLGEPVSRQAAQGRPPQQIVCVVYDGTEYHSFWGKDAIQQAISFIIEQDEDARIFAHYGGAFDHRFAHEWLFDRVKTSGSGWKVVTSGSLVIVCGGKIDGIDLQLVDSFRLLPGSLAEIGKHVGYAKSEWDHAWHYDSAFEGGQTKTGELATKRFRLHAPICYEALLRYCKRDCLVLWKGLDEIRQFAEDQGIHLRATIASTATASIRLKLDLDTIAWAPPEVEAVCVRAAFGGRVEPHAETCEESNVFDLQSSYPSAMMRRLPWRYLETRRKWRRGMIGIVEATVEVPADCKIPVLPFRVPEGKDKGRIFFPTGTWTGAFVSHELDYAIKIGAARLVEVQAFHRFEPSDVLAKFVRPIWKKRKGAIGFLRYALKIWMNAVYGKTNEKMEHEEILIHPETGRVICEIHRERPRRRGEGPCGCCLPIVPKHGMYATEIVHEPAFRAPWVAAAITAIARVALHKKLMEAIRKGGSVAYLDTDSCTTNVELETGRELGDLALERRISNGRFIAPKMYAYVCLQCDKKDKDDRPVKHPHDVVKAKGFTKLSREAFDRLNECGCSDGYRSGTAFGCPACAGGSLGKPGTGKMVLEFERTEGFREAVARGRLAYRRIKVRRQLRETRPKRSPEGRAWSVEELGRPWTAISRQLSAQERAP